MKAQLSSYSLAATDRVPTQDACDAVVGQDSLIAVVADGVGRAEHAGEAARRIVESMVANFKARPKAWGVARALEEFVKLANRTLYHESHARVGRPEMLSTVAALAIEGGRFSGLNAGDSRVYRLRSRELTQLSEDHVEVEPDLDHVLRRAVGMDREITAHPFEGAVLAGDVFLLCTDGVSDLLEASEIACLLQQRAGARAIIAAARQRATAETLDDMTAVVIDVIETDVARGIAATLNVPEALAPGDVIDGYTLLRPLNQNERAWLAVGRGEQVVLKVAPREARENEAIRNQFAKEIWSVTRLRAEYFIRAFVPEENRTFCYCMEYLDAPTLHEYLRAERLKVDEAVVLARFLLEASQFLLGFDLVHGDIKPENILVLKTERGLVFKLIDFGSVAEIFSVSSRAGTPSYLAPERFHGVALSERTEIFAMGVTVFQALAQRFPYGEIEPFQTPAFRAPKDVSKFNPNVPPWLNSVVLRAIAAAPDARYQNYSEMQFDLAHPEKVKPFVRADAPLLERNPLLFYKVACLLLLVLNFILAFKLLSSP